MKGDDKQEKSALMSSSASRRLVEDAVVISKNPLDPARGSLKKLVIVMKRPAATCPVATPKSFGEVKLHKYTYESYITKLDPKTCKWTLLVECTRENNEKVMDDIWAKIVQKHDQA